MVRLHTSLSSSAKAGDPVRRGFLELYHPRLWILGRPVKPGDDS